MKNVITGYAAVGDGVNDDTAEIQAAIDAAEAAGGDTVYFPVGIYLISAALVVNNNDVWLVGDRGGVVINLANTSNTNVISFDGSAGACAGGGVVGLEINGNRANNATAGHGIRVENWSRWACEDTYIRNIRDYGIGLQDGTISNININRVRIDDTGHDAIDFKNKNDDNGPSFISNVTISNFGYDAATQAGIDIRGPVHLQNISITGFPASGDGTGVRFRDGELLDANGYGGHRSTLKGFNIYAGAGTSAIGVTSVARDVTLSDGYVNGGLRGIQFQGLRNRAQQVTSEDSQSEGFRLHTDSDGSILVACAAINGDLRGFRITSPNCELIGCIADTNVTNGFEIEATATPIRIIGGRSVGNATAISDLAVNSSIWNVLGRVNALDYYRRHSWFGG